MVTHGSRGNTLYMKMNLYLALPPIKKRFINAYTIHIELCMYNVGHSFTALNNEYVSKLRSINRNNIICTKLAIFFFKIFPMEINSFSSKQYILCTQSV